MKRKRLTRAELRTLSKIAQEGRIIAKFIGETPRRKGLPNWTNNEFDLAKALIAIALDGICRKETMDKNQNETKCKSK